MELYYDRKSPIISTFAETLKPYNYPKMPFTNKLFVKGAEACRDTFSVIRKCAHREINAHKRGLQVTHAQIALEDGGLICYHQYQSLSPSSVKGDGVQQQPILFLL